MVLVTLLSCLFHFRVGFREENPSLPVFSQVLCADISFLNPFFHIPQLSSVLDPTPALSAFQERHFLMQEEIWIRMGLREGKSISAYIHTSPVSRYLLFKPIFSTSHTCPVSWTQPQHSQLCSAFQKRHFPVQEEIGIRVVAKGGSSWESTPELGAALCRAMGGWLQPAAGSAPDVQFGSSICCSTARTDRGSFQPTQPG